MNPKNEPLPDFPIISPESLDKSSPEPLSTSDLILSKTFDKSVKQREARPDSPIDSHEAKIDTGIQFLPDSIDPQERERCPEFFTGETTTKNKNKTPERYLLIRNHILRLWHDKRPQYVTKSSARKGLIGQGDVNAISRVWQFLDEWQVSFNSVGLLIPTVKNLSSNNQDNENLPLNLNSILKQIFQLRHSTFQTTNGREK